MIAVFVFPSPPPVFGRRLVGSKTSCRIVLRWLHENLMFRSCLSYKSSTNSCVFLWGWWMIWNLAMHESEWANFCWEYFFFQSSKKQPTRSLLTPSESLTSKWFESSRTWWQGKSLEKAVLWWIWYHGCYQDQSWKWMDKNDKKIRIRNRHCLRRVLSNFCLFMRPRQ